MGMFDSPMSFTDPQTMALLGVVSALGKAAMPSRLPVPTGAVLGQAAGGAMEGAQAYKNMLSQQQALGAGLANTKAVDQLNFLRKALGQPPVSANDVLTGKYQGLLGSNAPGSPAVPGVTPTVASPAVAPTAPATTGNAAPITATPLAPPAANANASGSTTPTGQTWEVAHNNLGGMRIPGTNAGPNAGGFQSFATPEAGVAAISHQLDRYASGATTGKPVTTLRGIVNTWAPPSENDTPALLARAQQITGFDPDAPLNVSDPAVKAKLIEATIRNEQGGQLPVDPAVIARAAGVQAPASQGVSDAPAATAPATPVGQFNDAARAASAGQGGALSSALQGAILKQYLGFGLTPVEQAMIGASMAPPGSVQQRLDQLSAYKAAGVDPVQNLRQGGALFTIDPATGKWVMGAQAPKLPVGAALQLGPNGMSAAPIPGATAAAGAMASAEAKGRLTPDVDPNAFGPPPGAPPAPTTPAVKTDHGTTLPPLSDAAPIVGSGDYLKDREKSWSETESGWNKGVLDSNQAQQRMLAIASALKQYQSGAFANNLSEIRAGLKAVGIQLPDAVAGDPAQAEIILKNNFGASLEQMRSTGLSRWTQAELFAAQKNTANPDLQPAANLAIIGQTVGTLRWEQAMRQDWAQAKRNGWRDPEDFQRAWAQQNPVQPFVDKAEAEVGPLKGMAGAPGGAPDAYAVNGAGHKIMRIGGKWYDATTRQPVGN